MKTDPGRDRSHTALSPGSVLAALLAASTLFLLVQCAPGNSGTPGESDSIDATQAPPDDSVQFAAIVTATLPAANPEHQQTYAAVDATSLMLRAAPRRDAKALHRLENREPVEVIEESGTIAQSGDSQTIDGVTGRWTKIRAIVLEEDRPRLLEGWVFGGYLTKNSDGEYQKAPAAGDFTTFFKVRPAAHPFDPRGKRFSYGVGCSGSTFSEYGLEVEFTGGKVKVSSTNAIVHDSASPSGKVCSTVERRIHLGIYSIQGSDIQLSFAKRLDETERFAGEEDANDCDQTDTSEKKVRLSDNYQIAYCYERGRTVPGILATIPGDTSDRIPAFWALMAD